MMAYDKTEGWALLGAGLVLAVGLVGGLSLLPEADASQDVDVAELHQMAAQQDRHGDILYILGLNLAAEGEHEAAVEHFTRALTKLPGRAEVQDARASSLVQLDKLTDALEDEEAAVAAEPDNPVFLTNRAWIYKKFGRADAALADLDRALELGPTLVGARFNRGAILFEQGDIDAARAEFSTCIDLAPGQPAPWFNRAMTWEAQGDLDKAQADMDRFVDLAPDDTAKGLGRELIARWGGT